jgi:hypothetical protein
VIGLTLRRAWRAVRHFAWDFRRRAQRTARDVALSILFNLRGFLLIVLSAFLLAAGVRVGMEKVLGWGPAWPALVFTLLAAAVWGTVFGLVSREWIRNPAGRVLPLSAAGVLLGGAAVWIYIFAALSYVIARMGAFQYEAAGKPEDLLYKLTDAYAFHFLDLLPGLNITTALGWKSPVDLEGGWRGVLLVLFRVAVIFQIFAKGRQLLRRDEPAKS